uniref:FLYWCH-type domain-containing protein n=1 Tax=Lutzomyia longipalpis TaxID=7200 RepID=A0A1B0GHA4_LUTLO
MINYSRGIYREAGSVHSLMTTDGKPETEEIHFARSMKGRPRLILKGYSYFRNNGNCERTYWLCSRNRYHKCKARVITSANYREIILKNQIHNHPPDPEINNRDGFYIKSSNM